VKKLNMDIKRAGSQPSGKGPSEWFTGTVRIDPLFQAPDPAFVQPLAWSVKDVPEHCVKHVMELDNVGYLSASQFSREYSRFFGTAPTKDISALRQETGLLV